jgi:hypothetical protein
MNRGNVINFGDELSCQLIEKISGKEVKWILPQKQNIFEKNFTKHVLAIGSILHFGAKNSLVWGSGLIEKSSKAPDAKYFAVRGKFTRKELLNRGYSIPEVYGDPGLLAPIYFDYKKTSKKYKVGIIPHYVEYDEVKKMFIKNNFSSEFKMIDLRSPVKQVLNEINQCQTIVSSSLHGIIIPQAYRIPTLRVSFTNKIIGDGIKYADYFDSVGIEHYKVPKLESENFNELVLLDLIDKQKGNLLINIELELMQDQLLKVKPF